MPVFKLMTMQISWSKTPEHDYNPQSDLAGLPQRI